MLPRAVRVGSQLNPSPEIILVEEIPSDVNPNNPGILGNRLPPPVERVGGRSTRQRVVAARAVQLDSHVDGRGVDRVDWR